MDSPGRSYAVARLRPGGRASLIEAEVAPGLNCGLIRLRLRRLVQPQCRHPHSQTTNASRGSAVGIEVAVRQPTMRRENTSDTNAVNAIPDQVGT